MATGAGRVLDAAVDLLELLGADVVRVSELAGPVHAARSGEIDAVGALDATGAMSNPPFPVVRLPGDPDPAAAWAASGAATLTGRPDGPHYGPPGVLVERILGVGAVVQLLAACRGVAIDLDPLALLGERSAIAGFGRRGSTSVGGACEIVQAADGWIAINLARPEDFEALPALLDGEAAIHDWPGVKAAIGRRTRRALVERATLLGVPLGAWPGPDGAAIASPFWIDGRAPRRRFSGGEASGVLGDAPERPLVVDLSVLWAGPLATSLLGVAGARVIKVESKHRPDGARRGPAAFFDLLNAGKESVAIDLHNADDRRLFQALIDRADLVVESSRPRALAQFGVDAAAVARRGTTTWISITGHGREGDAAMRVAFGDDAGFEAGCTVSDPPLFAADAIADPVTGLYGAAVGLAALVGQRGHVIDLALARAAGYARGHGGPRPTPYGSSQTVAPPRSRPSAAIAVALGEHSEAVRAELGYGRSP